MPKKVRRGGKYTTGVYRGKDGRIYETTARRGCVLAALVLLAAPPAGLLAFWAAIKLAAAGL